jgi:hypothetical protein
MPERDVFARLSSFANKRLSRCQQHMLSMCERGQWYLTTDILFWRIHRPLSHILRMCCRQRAGDCKAINERGTSHTTVTDLQADLLQFFSHPWASVAAKAETRLFFPSHRSFGSTAGQRTNLNLTAFGARRTALLRNSHVSLLGKVL